MIQLFLLPYAGGSKSSFSQLISCIDNNSIETIPIEYAGHGERYKEGLIKDYDLFLADVVNGIQQKMRLDCSYAMLGYSLGTALVYDIAANNLLKKKPTHLFYCARASLKDVDWLSISDDKCIKIGKKYGLLNDNMIEDSRLYSLFIRPMIEDFHVAFQYQYRAGTERIQCDSTVFYSNEDTPFDTVKGWSDLTDGITDYYAFGDSHFFMSGYYKEMADIINHKLIST